MMIKTLSRDPEERRWLIGRLPDTEGAYVKPGPFGTWRRAKAIGYDDTHLVNIRTRQVWRIPQYP